MKTQSVLNITCSKAINKESLPVDCNLLEELFSNKYEQQQKALRNETDPDKQNTLKMAMPALWPSCLFYGGSTSNHIVNHTGLIVVDIDAKDNQHIANFHNLKNEVCKIPNVAYCGLSVRGKGYFLIIPITYPDKHKQRINAQNSPMRTSSSFKYFSAKSAVSIVAAQKMIVKKFE